MEKMKDIRKVVVGAGPSNFILVLGLGVWMKMSKERWDLENNLGQMLERIRDGWVIEDGRIK